MMRSPPVREETLCRRQPGRGVGKMLEYMKKANYVDCKTAVGCCFQRGKLAQSGNGITLRARRLVRLDSCKKKIGIHFSQDRQKRAVCRANLQNRAGPGKTALYLGVARFNYAPCLSVVGQAESLMPVPVSTVVDRRHGHKHCEVGGSVDIHIDCRIIVDTALEQNEAFIA